MTTHTIPDTIRERLLKLKTLYERGGTEHERDAAFQHLEKLLNQYNLTLADLEQRVEDYYSFSFKSDWELRLLNQLAGYVSGWRTDGTYYTDGKKRTSILLKLTAAEYADLTALYKHYRQAWAKALDDFYGAWLQAQGLARPVEASSVELSKDDIIAILRRERIMKAIQVLPAPLKQLTAGE
jgi:hypothetical protein